MKSCKRLLYMIKVIRQFGLDKFFLKHHHSLWVRLFFYLFCFWRPIKQDKSDAERFKLALHSMGPVYVKLGQMLSTRRDLLNETWSHQLAQLQEQVPSFCSNKARHLIEQELGQSIDALFTEFESAPMASASMAQVHSATLKATGASVVIKVLRPDIADQIDADLELMKQVVRLLEVIVPKSQQLKLPEIVADYEHTILQEQDFLTEADNTKRLRKNFSESSSLYVPRVYDDLCTSKVIVMERIYGIRVDDTEALKAQGVDLKKLAERGVEIFFMQVFRDNFFHADMHPGNIFVSTEPPEDPQYIGIDCGIIGTLTEHDKHFLAQCFLAFFQQNYLDIAKLFIHSGWVLSSTDQKTFEHAIATLCRPLFQKPLHEISFAHFLIELFQLAKKYQFHMQPQLFLLQKTLLYVEGLGRQLYPELDLWQTAQPYLEHWMQKEMGSKASLYKSMELLPKVIQNLPDIPDLVYDNLHMGRRILQSQQQLFEDYHRVQKSSDRSQYLILTAGFLFLGCLLIDIHDQADVWIRYGLGFVAFIFWWKGWKDHSKSKKTFH